MYIASDKPPITCKSGGFEKKKPRETWRLGPQTGLET